MKGLKVLTEGCGRKIKDISRAVMRAMEEKAGVKTYDCTIKFGIPSGKRQPYSQKALEDRLYDEGLDCEFIDTGTVRILFEDIARVTDVLRDYGCRNVAMIGGEV